MLPPRSHLTGPSHSYRHVRVVKDGGILWHYSYIVYQEQL